MSKREAFEAALNAVLGDYLEARGSALSTRMGLYHRGRPLAALPPGGTRLCLLIHGMACTESCWSYPDQPDRDYGSLLARDHGMTPLYLRYNTGLRIRDNGAQLARLLDGLIASSPTPVEELTLVGHSLGGLLIRSACHQGEGSAWLPRVRRAFYLGSPHLGSPLEKAGHVATSVLHAIDDPVVQLIGDLAEVRSAAVKDLRHGTVTESGALLPLDARFAHYLIAGTLPGPLAALLGDGVVRVPSATGARGAGNGQVALFPGLHHMAILHSDEVYAWISGHCGARVAGTPVAPRVRTGGPDPGIGAYLALLEDAVDKGSEAVQRVHEAIAARTYDLVEMVPPLQPPTRLLREVHFRALRGTYATLRLVNGLLGSVARSAIGDEDLES